MPTYNKTKESRDIDHEMGKVPGDLLGNLPETSSRSSSSRFTGKIIGKRKIDPKTGRVTKIPLIEEVSNEIANELHKEQDIPKK